MGVLKAVSVSEIRGFLIWLISQCAAGDGMEVLLAQAEAADLHGCCHLTSPGVVHAGDWVEILLAQAETADLDG